MNRTIERVSLVALLLLAVAALQCVSTKTIGRPALPKPDFVVAQDGSTDYETIGDALDDAEPDNVILVKPGVYEEAIEIAKDAKSAKMRRGKGQCRNQNSEVRMQNCQYGHWKPGTGHW